MIAWWWVAVVGLVGVFFGFLIASVAAAAGAASREEEYEADLAALQRRGKLQLYDQDASVEEDALEFSQRMVSELAQQVGALRSVCYEAVAWLESRPDATEGDAATSSRIRAVLEDIEAEEEAR